MNYGCVGQNNHWSVSDSLQLIYVKEFRLLGISFFSLVGGAEISASEVPWLSIPSLLKACLLQREVETGPCVFQCCGEY